MSPSDYQIGAWTVHPALDEVRRNGEVVKLEPRTMRLLLALAEHPGEVLSISDLLEQVWPSVVVSPDSVYQAIAGLRRILGDDPRQPTYIVNVQRRGYRLIAPVLRTQPSESPCTVQPPESSLGELGEENRSNRSPTDSGRDRLPRLGFFPRGALIGAVCVLILSGSVILGWFLRRGETSAAAGIIPPPPAQSIAVLPFSNLSGDPAQEYFSDGLSEELLNALARIDGLQVAARTSAFSFKGSKLDAGSIARRLNVSTLLEGSIRRSGETLRISTHLINASNGFDLWSQTFDSPVGDALQIQSEIAAKVSAALQLRFQQGVGIKASLGGTRNPDALDAFLRGYQLNQRPYSATDQRKAVAYFDRAVQVDPQYALAFAGRSEAHASIAEHEPDDVRGRKKEMEMAREDDLLADFRPG